MCVIQIFKCSVIWPESPEPFHRVTKLENPKQACSGVPVKRDAGLADLPRALSNCWKAEFRMTGLRTDQDALFKAPSVLGRYSFAFPIADDLGPCGLDCDLIQEHCANNLRTHDAC